MNKTLTQRLVDVASRIYVDYKNEAFYDDEYYVAMIFETIEDAGYTIVRKASFGDVA